MAEEPNQDAGEYVLGTMPPDERRAFVGRLAREPALAAEVAAWQQRLAPLALALDPVAPPAALWRRVEAGIGPVAANDRDGPGAWRVAAIAASLVAIAMSTVAVRQHRTVPPPVSAPVVRAPANMLLAALNGGGQAPGLFLRYDRATDRVTVVPVGLTADEAHSLEIWVIRGKDAPKPMWLVDPAKPADQHDARGRVTDGVTFAVSREPLGGSPTGLPTGPILYTGQLVKMPLS